MNSPSRIQKFSKIIIHDLAVPFQNIQFPIVRQKQPQKIPFMKFYSQFNSHCKKYTQKNFHLSCKKWRSVNIFLIHSTFFFCYYQNDIFNFHFCLQFTLKSNHHHHRRYLCHITIEMMNEWKNKKNWSQMHSWKLKKKLHTERNFIINFPSCTILHCTCARYCK